MWKQIKNKFYFFCASYFKFWAKLRLKRWNPYIIVVTGSSGKTTLLHLLESQISTRARYSHLANSAFGIPFDILGIHRKTFTLSEWPRLLLQAPLAVASQLPREKIYIAEADCDRPKEGHFLATLLKPHLTLWLTISKTHAHNFDDEVRQGQFPSIEEAISHEFGSFLEHTQETCYISGDSTLMRAESGRSQAQVVAYQEKEWVTAYKVTRSGTAFSIKGQKHTFDKVLLPEVTWLALGMCLRVCQKLGITYDYNYTKFSLPPGRSSLFAGIKKTTLIDSTYNSNYDSMKAMLDLLANLPLTKKWIVLGDMVELGEEEEEEHKKLGKLLAQQESEQIILIGPRLQKYALPLLKDKKVIAFLEPKEALIYITSTLKGGETILFKGSRFLEGILAQLLVNKKNQARLCRREAIWQKRRAKWRLV